MRIGVKARVFWWPVQREIAVRRRFEGSSSDGETSIAVLILRSKAVSYLSSSSSELYFWRNAFLYPKLVSYKFLLTAESPLSKGDYVVERGV